MGRQYEEMGKSSSVLLEYSEGGNFSMEGSLKCKIFRGENREVYKFDKRIITKGWYCLVMNKLRGKSGYIS